MTISGSKTVNVTNAVTVASLTLASKAVLSVTARPLADTSPFAVSQDAAAAALWANRLVFKVTGALTVPSGCTVKPYNNKRTGTPVAFEVGSADIAGTIDATGAGWGWTELGDKELPAGAFKQHIAADKPWYYTFAFGSTKGDIGGYGWGTSHGGKGSGTSRAVYGYAAAPFLPGSPSSLYSANYNTRGGGSVIIHATGTINLTGTITAIGKRNSQNAGTSGGGVWLAAKSIVRGDTSLINANGEAGHNGNQGQGGGGRVALTYGASAAELAELATGAVPVTITVTDLVADNVTVKGGKADAKVASDGTKTEGMSANLRTKITVQSDAGFDLTAEGVIWGAVNVDVGSNYEFAAPEYGFAAADPSNVRKAFTGYVISNRTAEVVRKAERELVFSPVAGEGPYTLTWLTGPRETRTTVGFIGDGAGTVTEGGVAHDGPFELWKSEDKTVALTAVAAEGSKFVEYACSDLQDGYSDDPELALPAAQPHVVDVLFAAGRIKRSFVGKTVEDLSDPLKWSPAGVPDAEQEAHFTNKTLAVTSFPKYAKLVISGGAFTFGGATSPRGGFTFEVADELEISGGAKVTFYARELEDLSVFADKTTAAAAIWASRGVVKVGGRFSVSGGATVYPVNDLVTGVPVVFEVGSFDLAADGTIDANGAGWRWQPVGSRTFPEGVTKYTGAAKIDGTSYDSVFTLAFAPGSSYGIGASHGGLGAPREGSVKPVYGYRAAPFLPGSPGGTHEKTVPVSNGGGTICILAKGSARLCGKMAADAVHNGAYSGASGGGVWVVAGQITQTDTLTVTAKGSSNSNSNHKPGAGGRVALVSGVDPASDVFAGLVAGGEPESLSYADLAFVGLSVAGARNGDTTKCIAADGTAVQAFDPTAFETLTVCGAPLAAVSTGVAYGDAQLLPGSVSYAVTDYGYDPADMDNVRYSCGGWVVSNATGLVSEDVTATASFDIVKGEGPYTLTWLWVERETRTVVTPAPAFGAIACGGDPVLEETVYWVRDNATLTLDAVPEDGCTLTTWRGVPRGGEAVARQVLSGAEPHTVTAFFHDSASAATRYWKKGADGDFYVAANWEGGVVPGFGDTAVVSNGTCRVTDRLQLAGLVVTNGATVRITNADVVTVADDLALYGSAKLYVTARPLDETHTFATGTARVTVGGTLSLAGTSTLYPESDAWSGSTVRFDVGDFELAAGASVNADNLGWGWLTYTGTPAAGATTCESDGVKFQTIALGRGWSYSNGGSYATKANTSSGPVYGWTNSVVHAGSPNGVYGTSTYRGGGLIRIHAKGRTTVDGTLSADGNTSNVYGGPSGGGIWLTAKEFSFGDAAVLRARGGTANYSSNGSGGRIAIGVCTDEQRIDELAETGTYPGLRKGRIHDEAFFRENVGNASMTIDVHSRPNASQVDKPGTFVYLDATRTGLMLLVK